MTRNNWNEIDTPDESDNMGHMPELILRMWQRTDGLVLSVEELNENSYQLVTLPENFRQDNQVIDHIGDYDEKGKAIQNAEAYMEEN